MNVCKKISIVVGLGLIFSVGVAHARVTEFKDLLPNHPGKDYATVLAATVSTLDNVVVYIGAGTCFRLWKQLKSSVKNILTCFLSK